MRATAAFLVAAAIPLAGIAAARAADPVTMTLKDHHFIPDHVEIPADTRVRIEVSNQDATAGEIESYDMKFEKIVVPGGTAGVFAGPLHPGTYKFFDDYHPETAVGTVTVTAAKG